MQNYVLIIVFHQQIKKARQFWLKYAKKFSVLGNNNFRRLSNSLQTHIS